MRTFIFLLATAILTTYSDAKEKYDCECESQGDVDYGDRCESHDVGRVVAVVCVVLFPVGRADTVDPNTARNGPRQEKGATQQEARGYKVGTGVTCVVFVASQMHVERDVVEEEGR